PDFPSPSQDTSVSIENELFGEMVDYVIYAVSQDEKRPAHTGILIKLENKKLTMVALDGYRLAVCERVVDFEGNFSMIVPAKAMNEVRKIIGEKDGKLTIYSNRRYILFKASEFIVLSRLLEGDFLDYKKAIPQNFVVAATVKTKSFIDVIERVSLIITERLKNPLKLEIGENNIVVKCTTELGTVYDELDATVDGEELEIGFNNRYVLDALKASKKEELVFEFSGSLSPCVIHPKDSDDFTYLVLPVRFKND
ncbi:MAG: DNA polymerase III subunit beta, partial [Oscillospiraceae bacterium]